MISHYREFPGGPVVRTRHIHCRGLGSIPGHRAKIPQAVWYDPKKKKSNHSLRIVTWNNNQKIPMFLLCFHNYNSTITSSVLEGLLYFGAVLCGTWDLSSLRRDWTHTPCSGSTGSYPLDHQASPFCRHFSGINLYMTVKACMQKGTLQWCQNYTYWRIVYTEC